jgi:hypothetical protein
MSISQERLRGGEAEGMLQGRLGWHFGRRKREQGQRFPDRSE